jgi:nucleoside-diphosphate-sugar epimerase
VARAEPEAIIHQMTSLSGMSDMRHFDRTFRTTNTLRTTGTRHLLAAADAAGVKRFLAQSYTGWPITRTGEGPSTESEPFDAHPVRGQRETLAAIRTLEQSVLDAPLTGIVLRYGSLYGAGAWDPLIELVRKRMLPIIGDGGGVWSWIHVDDAASATVAALERGEPGVYNVVDDEPAPAAEWIPGLAELAGAKPPLRVPVWLGRLLAGEVVVHMMTKVRGASNEKAKWVLDWRPRWPSWREGFRHALGATPTIAAPRGGARRGGAAA